MKRLFAFISTIVFSLNLSAQYEAQIFPNDSSLGDQFSSDVLLNYPWLLAGARYKHVKPHSGGSVYVFRHENSGWKQKEVLLPKPDLDDFTCGSELAHYANRYAFGCPSMPGSVYCYELKDTVWEFRQRITPSIPSAMGFGSSIAMDRNRMLVGAPLATVNGVQSGAVFVYRYTGSQWVEEQVLTDTNAATGDAFGSDVALYDTIAIVGAHTKHTVKGPYSGSAFIFTFDGVTWQQREQLLPSDIGPDDGFGFSVAMYRDNLFIGTSGGGPNDIGSVYWYRYNGTGWQQVQEIVPDDSMVTMGFGCEISVVNGNRMLIGAYEDYQANIQAGAVYLYSKYSGQWVKSRKIVPSNALANQGFGFEVSLQGNRAAVSSGIIVGSQVYGSVYIYDICSFPSVMVKPDYPVCPGDSVHLRAGCPEDSVNWFDKTGLLLAGSHKYSFIPAGNDTVWAELWSTGTFYGFVGFDTVVIEVEPRASFTADTVCPGQPTHFTDFTQVSTPWHYWWDFDNDGVVDDTTQGSVSYTYPAEGTYTAKLTVENLEGCRDSVYRTVKVGCTGISPVQEQPKISVWPNPGREVLHVTLSLAEPGHINLGLYDALGRKLWEETRKLSSGREEWQIATGNLPEGVYLLRVQTGRHILARPWVKE